MKYEFMDRAEYDEILLVVCMIHGRELCDTK